MIIVGSLCLALLFLNVIVEFLKWISMTHFVDVYEKKIVIDAYQSHLFIQPPQQEEEQKDESEECEH